MEPLDPLAVFLIAATSAAVAMILTLPRAIAHDKIVERLDILEHNVASDSSRTSMAVRRLEHLEHHGRNEGKPRISLARDTHGRNPA